MTKKLAVITGASSGIGEATAKAFSNAGYPTLLLARRLEKMESFNLTNSPEKPSIIESLQPIVSVVIIAQPAAEASNNTFGIPSLYEGKHTIDDSINVFDNSST